ncbi:Swt1 family HEPN domain-containing protein [Actinomadura parmotrematis]|uniref:Swt1-like HEPN domain-containing protein n=1 Tax=Actinomadura parmotrematis TaxID=2864039 RepID=A0ABS7FU66_9ACTN|nr:Swt1 family HEPN domain-containing protein [Actinomadura parmotrematis]MBW8483132.1 hypothetical protein [Actinomadura parmotrematis]
MVALSDRERVGRGLELLVGLGPFVDRHMRKAVGKDWLARLEQRDTERFGHAKKYDLHDPRYLLRVVTEERDVFKPVLSPRGVGIASRLREVGNKYGHEFDDAAFDRASADRALADMAELLRLAGATAQAADVQRIGAPGAPKKAPAKKAAPKKKRSGGKRAAPVARAAPAPVKAKRGFPRWAGFAAVGAGAVVVLGAGYAVFADDGAAANDPYQGKYAGKPVGATLGTYKGIDLSDGYRLLLVDDPAHPAKGDGADLARVGNVLKAADERLAVLGKKGKAGFARCRDTTRYAAALPLTGKGLVGQRFCVTTDRGAVGLFTVRGLHSGTSRYVTVDLVVWKGPRR